jgi:adenine/guanine phosphoribosyltransferase-like PRPP-binding protein
MKKYQPSGDSCCHLTPILHPKLLKKVIDDLVIEINKSKLKFEAIAVRGLSGTLVAAPVALALNKEIIAVRKKVTDHSPWNVENVFDCNYIIIDDLMQTGHTATEIISKINKIENKAKCVGIFLYNNECDMSHEATGAKELKNVPIFLCKESWRKICLEE